MSDPTDPAGAGKGREHATAAPDPAGEGAPLDRIRRLAALEPIDPKLVAERLVMLFHAEIGGVARALSVVDRAAAREVADQIRIAVGALTAELAERAPRAEPAAPMAIAARLVNKTRDVLLRERIIMRRVTATDRELPSKDLLAEARKGEPDLKETTMTATLDRLQADGLIMRERKGRYRSNARSQDYLDAIEREIDRLGED